MYFQQINEGCSHSPQYPTKRTPSVGKGGRGLFSLQHLSRPKFLNKHETSLWALQPLLWPAVSSPQSSPVICKWDSAGHWEDTLAGTYACWAILNFSHGWKHSTVEIWPLDDRILCRAFAGYVVSCSHGINAKWSAIREWSSDHGCKHAAFYMHSSTAFWVVTQSNTI